MNYSQLIGLMRIGLLSLLVVTTLQAQSVNTFKKQNKILISEIKNLKTIYDLLKTNERCIISKYEITRVSNDESVIVSSINSGNDLSSKTLSLFSKIEIGDKFYIENIMSVGNCLEYQENGQKSYLFIVE